MKSADATSSGTADFLDQPDFLKPGEEAGPFDDLDMGKGESKKTGDSKPRSGPPRLDEWQDLFSRVIIKTATNYYLEMMFRGIDEEELSPSELRRIALTEEERDRIAKPFSELANKLGFTRKHGRTIIAASGTVDSVLMLALWFGRVNKIAARHRGPEPIRVKVKESYVHPRPDTQSGGNGRANGTEFVPQPPGFGPGFDGFPEAPGTG